MQKSTIPIRRDGTVAAVRTWETRSKASPGRTKCKIIYGTNMKLPDLRKRRLLVYLVRWKVATPCLLRSPALTDISNNTPLTLRSCPINLIMVSVLPLRICDCLTESSNSKLMRLCSKGRIKGIATKLPSWAPQTQGTIPFGVPSKTWKVRGGNISIIRATFTVCRIRSVLGTCDNPLSENGAKSKRLVRSRYYSSRFRLGAASRFTLYTIAI